MSSGLPVVRSDGPHELGWSWEASERCDYYHRPRLIPEPISAWRKSILTRLFDGAGEQKEPIRTRFDLALGLLREVARAATLLYPDAPGEVQLRRSKDALRVLERIDPFRLLARAVPDASRKKVSALELIPSILQGELSRGLGEHGRQVCTEIAPQCASCEIQKLCSSWRATVQEAERQRAAPTVIDLFCGAGGLSEGFSRAGFKSLAALDADEASLRTYSLNHPTVPDEGIVCEDIRLVEMRRWLRIVGKRRLDVLAAAPPCQGFSHAGFRSKSTSTGYRLGADERNFLFEPAMAIAIALKPRFVLLENVPGMQSAKRENLSFLEHAARLLETRGRFQTAVWRVNAAAFGVPQDRERYFLIAAAHGEQLPLRPSEEYQDARGRFFDLDALPSVRLEEAIFDLPSLDAGSGSAIARWNREAGDDLRARRYLRKFGLLRDSALIYNHAARYHNPRDLELYALLKPGEDSVHAIERYGRNDLMRYRTDVFDDKYARLRPDRPSKTIVSHLAKDGNGYIHPFQVRSITPREAARIQSFDDGYAFCGSVSDQWVQIGNAVPPVLAEAIARSILGSLHAGRGAQE